MRNKCSFPLESVMRHLLETFGKLQGGNEFCSAQLVQQLIHRDIEYGSCVVTALFPVINTEVDLAFRFGN